jgi:hypothetical protein
MIKRVLPFVAVCVLASPAAAEQRRVGLTSFDRIEIAGNMTVEIRADHRINAVIDGSRDALDSMQVEVVNRTLYVRQLAVGTFGPRRADVGPVVVRIAAQNLRAVQLHGAGAVNVVGLRGPETQIFLNGPGQLTVSGIAVETLLVRTSGNGTMTLAGRARNVQAALNGGGGVNALALSADALRVVAVGPGSSQFTAVRTADVQVNGTGGLTVDGRPNCTVRNLSSGTVRCGTPREQAVTP